MRKLPALFLSFLILFTIHTRPIESRTLKHPPIPKESPDTEKIAIVIPTRFIALLQFLLQRIFCRQQSVRSQGDKIAPEMNKKLNIIPRLLMLGKHYSQREWLPRYLPLYVQWL